MAELIEVAEKYRGDEVLAEAVRKFPVLYKKSLKEFRDNSIKKNAWKSVAEEACCSSAEEAQRKFTTLRGRYTRDKAKIYAKTKSGAAAADVKTAKQEASALYPFLTWLDSHIAPRRRTSTNVTAGQEGAMEGDDGEEDEVIGEGGDVCTLISEATGRPKWAKKQKVEAEEEVGDPFEKQMLSCLANLAQPQPQGAKDEEEVFGAYIASQLRTMTPEQNALAQFRISQVCIEAKLASLGMLQTSLPMMQTGLPSGSGL